MCTTLATSVYTKLPLVKYYAKFLIPQICIALEVVLLKLYTKLAPGWALIRVNFDTIHKVYNLEYQSVFSSFKTVVFTRIHPGKKKAQTDWVYRSRSVHFLGSGKVLKCGPWPYTNLGPSFQKSTYYLRPIVLLPFYGSLVCSGLWSQEQGRFTCYSEPQFMVTLS